MSGWLAGLAAVALTLILVPIVIEWPAQSLVVILIVAILWVLWMARRRITKSPGFVVRHRTAVVLLPTAVSLATQSVPLSAALLAVILLVLALGKRDGNYRPRWPFYALLGSAVIVWAQLGDLLSLGKVALIAVIVIVAAFRVRSDRLIASLVDGVGLYLVANIAAWLVGVRSPSATERTGGFEGGLLFVDRVLFPLTPSVNTIAGVAAVYVLAAVALMVTTKVRWYQVMGVLVAMFVLLATGARTPLVLAVVGSVVIVLLPRLLARLSPIVVALGLTLPLYFVFIQPAIKSVSDFATSLIPALAARDGQGGNESLNGRDFIWTQALQHWQSLPTLNQAFGFGPGGHYKSGASLTYGRLFGDYTSDVAGISPHSSLMQQIFDGGVIGAVLFTVALVGATAIAARRYLRERELISLVPVAVIVGLSLTAAVESALAPSTIGEMFVIALLAAGALPAALRGSGDDDAEDRDVVGERVPSVGRATE